MILDVWSDLGSFSFSFWQFGFLGGAPYGHWQRVGGVLLGFGPQNIRDLPGKLKSLPLIFPRYHFGATPCIYIQALPQLTDVFCLQVARSSFTRRRPVWPPSCVALKAAVLGSPPLTRASTRESFQLGVCVFSSPYGRNTWYHKNRSSSKVCFVQLDGC